MSTVHVLTIDDSFGTQTTAHRTNELAEAALWRYVAGRWRETFVVDAVPDPGDNPWPHIERFFDRCVEDSFTIVGVELEDEGPFASAALLEEIRDRYVEDHINVDEPALVSEADDGCWVQGWLWVPGWNANGPLPDRDDNRHYVIRNTNCASLAWSNLLGWVDGETCDVFDEAEKEALNLPVDGRWCRLDPTNKRAQP